MSNTTQKNFPVNNLTGRPVVSYTSSQSLKGLLRKMQNGYVDVQTLSDSYLDNPDKHHLGLVDLAAAVTEVKIPDFYKRFWQDYNMMEVEGIGSAITYSTPVTETNTVTTIRDTSAEAANQSSEAHIPIVLNIQLQPGHVIGYDEERGQQFVVLPDYPITADGDGWRHIVQPHGFNVGETVENSPFKAGYDWFILGHGLTEYSEQFASIQDRGLGVGTITSEWVFGNHRGVEAAMTGYASQRNIPAQRTKYIGLDDELRKMYEMRGKDVKGRQKDMMAIPKEVMKTEDGRVVPAKGATVYIGTILEALVLKELTMLESFQLMWQKGGTIQHDNGVLRLNEGKIPQIRRGKIITYTNRVRRHHFREAASYIYAGARMVPMHERKMRYDVGYQMWLQVMQIFREEFTNQMVSIPGLGTDRILPSSPVTGSLDALKISPVMIKEAPIQDLGIISVDHDPTFDFIPVSTRNTGYRGEGYSRRSYTAMMEDFTSPKYSNVKDISGANLVENGTASNIYYIKPYGATLHWGSSIGRWNFNNMTGQVISSLKQMGKEIWAHSMSALLVVDPTRYVIIEQE